MTLFDRELLVKPMMPFRGVGTCPSCDGSVDLTAVQDYARAAMWVLTLTCSKCRRVENRTQTYAAMAAMVPSPAYAAPVMLTAAGVDLDRLGGNFGLVRLPGQADADFRSDIQTYLHTGDPKLGADERAPPRVTVSPISVASFEETLEQRVKRKTREQWGDDD